jgi:hypothetical protein
LPSSASACQIPFPLSFIGLQTCFSPLLSFFLIFCRIHIFTPSNPSDYPKSAKMTAQAYLERYRQLCALDQQKNEFIEVATISPLVLISCSQDYQELLQRVTALENSFQQEKLDHERETRFNRDIQLHEMELMEQISSVKNMMVSASMGRKFDLS